MNTYDLTMLRDSLVENEDIKDMLIKQEEAKKAREEAKKVREEEKKEEANRPVSQHKMKAFDPQYVSMLKKRLWIINKIIDNLTNHEGVRGNLLFVAYNCARYLWSEEEARKYCRNLNERFNPRFRSIKYLFRNQKKYKIKEIDIPSYFNLTQEEYEALSKEYYRVHRNDARSSARKDKREKKEAVKSQAAELLASGQKISDVSDQTGLSISVVKKISALQNRNKTKDKPWDMLGISRATYYRRKKNGLISLNITQNSSSNAVLYNFNDQTFLLN